MGEPVNLTLRRNIRELAGDCRIDREDAREIVESALEDAGVLKADRQEIVNLLRNCSPRMDGQAFEVFKNALGGGPRLPENRILLKPGDRGPEVQRYRAALTAASRVVGDRRLDPGPGNRFDRQTELATRALQARFHQPVRDYLDSGTLQMLNFVLRESDHPQFDPERPDPKPKGISLHFYPGPKKMLVLQHGREIDRYDMRGGPEEMRADPRPGNHTWGPTPRGRYTIRSLGRHVSRTWKYSQIPWGAKIREQEGVIQFQIRDGAPWHNATGPDSVFKDRAGHLQFQRQDFLFNGQVIGAWDRNDFGHLTAYLERNGQRQNHMIHATPYGERRYGDDRFELLESHGCEHLRPADLDEAMAKGYIRKGVPFVVHGYDEELRATSD